MDEFFESIFSFVIIIGVVLRFVNKSKKKGAPAKAKGKAAQIFEELMDSIETAAPVKPKAAPAGTQNVFAPEEVLLPDGDCPPGTRHGHGEGASHSDEMGCIGGSMAHDSHEGKSAPLSAGIKSEGPGSPGANAAPGADRPAASKARFDAKSMRKAFIAGEILREPVSLRGKVARR